MLLVLDIKFDNTNLHVSQYPSNICVATASVSWPKLYLYSPKCEWLKAQYSVILSGPLTSAHGGLAPEIALVVPMVLTEIGFRIVREERPLFSIRFKT